MRALGLSMLRMAAAVLTLAFAVPALADLLPGGSPADQALRESALAHSIEAVKAALTKGGNPDSPSNTARRITPLGAAARGSWTLDEHGSRNETGLSLSQKGLTHNEIDNHLALEISKLLFAAGAKLGPYDREILFHPIANGNAALIGLLIDKGASARGDLEGYTPTPRNTAKMTGTNCLSLAVALR
jgi:hypothetical protein